MGECEVKSGSQGPTLERVPPMSMPNQGIGGSGSGPNSGLATTSSPSEGT